MSKRVIAITGGQKGIGAAIAELFYKKNWVVETCSRGLVKDSKYNHNQVDVREESQCREWIEDIVQRNGKVDVLVNNAGTIQSEPGKDWDQVIATNLSAVWYTCLAAYSHMPMDGSARIVNIASVLGQIAVADQPAYCASKHGVIGLTKSLALRLATKNITVNAICPGWVETEMMQARLQQMDISRNKITPAIPLKKIIQPVQIADAVEYLVGEGACMMTGQCLTIDGGFLAGPA